MVDGVIESTELSDVGAIVSSEAVRLDRLVSDLLELARFGAVDFHIDESPVDLTDVVSTAAMVWQDRCAREGVTFSVELPDAPVMINTDVGRVRQIIDNLAENALRVTPSGAPIILALTQDAVIEIRDGGPGLSDDDVQVAFEPGELFERYRGVRKVGTGFGLALVGRLANRLGAVATAGTSPEGGAQFRIDFSSRLIA
jgi:two-component system sensor histidine kinase BaeS